MRDHPGRWLALVGVVACLLIGALLAIPALQGPFATFVDYSDHPRFEAARFVGDVAVAPDGSSIYVAVGDAVEVRSIPGAKLLRTLTTGETFEIAVSPDGTVLATTSRDPGGVNLWRSDDGTLLHRIDREYASALAFSPDSKTLAVGAYKTVYLYGVADGVVQRTIASTGWSLQFSPDGRLLGMGGDPLRVWSLPEDKLVRELPGWFHIVFAPDGATVAVADSVNGGDVTRRRLSDGQIGAFLKGGAGQVHGLSFSPDGQVIAAVTNDSQVRIWRASDGLLLKNEQHADQTGLDGLHFTPDGQTLLLWDMHKVFTWRIDLANSPPP